MRRRVRTRLVRALAPAMVLAAVSSAAIASTTPSPVASPASAGSPAAAPAASPAAAAAAAAAPTVGDGTMSATAGASCWGIRQQVPTAPDGLYWLVNPQLVHPRQFWCDMTTDGGGWVLVGRGREGWSWRDRGQGGSGNVAATSTGPAAFAVQYYPSATVDALLAGARPDALDDGVRVRRAADATGSTWQEVRYALHAVPQWSWGFAAGLPLTSVTVAGTRYTPRTTYDTFPATRNDRTRVYTYDWAAARPRFSAGFAYGAGVLGGTNSATTYLWQNGREGAPVPFAQVYLRPRLANSTAGGTPIPDAGLPAVTVPHLLSSMSEPLSGWGVTGYDPATAPASTWKSNALALAQVGERIYVGGTFRSVQRGATGKPVAQSYLAAFDRRTGAFLPAFRPVLDGGVWALAVTADGTLVAGGRFTRVNGARRPALVALDPATGATRAAWVATPSVATGTATVRSLAVRGGWLYVGGAMTSLSGGSGALGRRITVSNLARVDATTGRPDLAFRPVLASQPWSITTSVLADRVYVTGAFTTANGVATDGTAVLDATTGRSIPGLTPVAPSWQCANPCPTPGYHPYAQAMVESADGQRVFAAPTEHNLQMLDRTTMARTYSHITASGGDFQSVAETDGVVYATCHCFGWDYSGATRYLVGQMQNALSQAGTVDRISSVNGIGAYDSATLAKIDAFEPSWKGRYSDGMWASLVDSAGCVWFAGDVVVTSLNRWAGGFVKYCPRDSVAPSTPESFAVTRTTTPAGTAAARLVWAGGGDASGSVTFQVLRDDRVVATTTALGWTDGTATAGARYAVRTVDATGNLSATTPVSVYAG